MTPRLRIVSSELPGRAGLEVELGEAPIVIGRAPDCAVRLEDPAVSRRHARVEASGGGGFAVVDLGSANGIVVGDERVTMLRLEKGGRFSIGGSLFEYDGPAPEPPVDTGATLVRPPARSSAPVPAPPEFVVRVLSSKGGEAAGKEFRVAGGSADIGRDEACGVPLSRDASVSRRHARVVRAEGGFRVVDLGSANGIWIDDRRVTELQVGDGEPFRVGDCMLECRALNAGPRTDSTQAMSDLGELMAKVAARRLEQAGQPVELSARASVLLDEPGLAFYVVSGKVEVFTVAVDGGRPHGARQHFLTVPEGGAVFGVAPGTTRGWGFLVVGRAGTVVRRVPREDLGALASDAQLTPVVASLVDGWVEAVAARLTRDVGPRPVADVALPAGMAASLPAGHRAQAEQGVVWVDGGGAPLLFVGMAPVPPEDGGGAFVPLTAQAWIEHEAGAGEDASLTTCATADLLGSKALWSGLDRFHELVCECEFVNKRLAAVDEYQRLDDKARESEAAREAAFDAIGAVLGGRPPDAPVDAGSGRLEPVLAAARLVGAALGVEVRPPAEATGERTFHEHVAAIASASRFRVRLVALRGEWWRSDAGPLLGGDAQGSPVALLPRGARSYTCVDVAAGTRRRVTAEVAEGLVPFAFAFYRPLPPGPLGALDLWRFGTRGLLADRAAVLGLGILTGLLAATIPLLVGQVVDRAIPQAERAVLFQLGLGMLAVTLGGTALQLAKSVAMVRLETRMDHALQAGVWDRLLELPATFFRQYGAGDLAERAGGINAIRTVLSRSAVTAGTGAIGAVAYLAAMAALSPSLTAVALLVALVLVAFSTVGNVVLLRAQRSEVDLHGQISSLVLQLIAGVAKVRVSGAENHAFRVWAQRFSEQKRLSFRVGRLGALLATVAAGFQVLAPLAIFAAIHEGQSDGPGSGLTTGQFVAFYSAFAAFVATVQGLSNASVSLLAVVPYYQRLQPILATLPETDPSKAYPGRLQGEVAVSRVHFRYRPDSPLVLQDVSFTARPGEFVAFVGPSGCGKSTLLRVLLGLEKPDSGAVTYDGLDLAHLDVRAVRQQLGVVLQESRVLPTDVFRNIVGNSSRTLAEAWEAAEMAGLAEDLRQMPMQLHTVVSEGGGTFSGGQRQRLLIARALVHKPRILLFDEATSALDNRAQAVVTQSMARLDATRIVVAHRLSTIVDADRILFLDGGQVREEGTYDQLMRRNGQFAEFARRQMA